MQDPLSLAEDEFKKIVKTNFMAACYLLKAVGKAMRDQKSGGSIIFLTSILGAERGLYPGAAVYGSCLAGVQQLVRVRLAPLYQRCKIYQLCIHIDTLFILPLGCYATFFVI